MAVGHYIGDKGRVIERRRNKKSGGSIEEEKNYFQMDEGANLLLFVHTPYFSLVLF